MFSNHIWQEFLLQYLLPLQLWLLSIPIGLSLNSLYFLISMTLSPFPPPKALFPHTPVLQNPATKTGSNTNSPMNCSLIPSIGATVSFLHGPLKKYLTRSYHGMVSSTPNTLMLWQHSPSIIPCPANIWVPTYPWVPNLCQLMGIWQWTQSQSSPSEGSHSVVVGGNHNPTWGLSLVELGLSIPGFYSWMPFSEVCGAWAWPS